MAQDIDILLIDRGDPPDYYYSSKYIRRKPHNAPIEPSGNARRSIKNIDQLESLLKENYVVHRVSLENETLYNQIRLFNRSQLIIGQHGAGLSGVVWCRPQSGVIEIIPTNMLKPNRFSFGNLSQVMSLYHYFIVQRDSHDYVDITTVNAFAESILKTNL